MMVIVSTAFINNGILTAVHVNIIYYHHSIFAMPWGAWMRKGLMPATSIAARLSAYYFNDSIAAIIATPVNRRT